MKKIKLLTPILGLATIATSIVPLTSCNNDKEDSGDQKNVTLDEWHTALDKIWNVREDRNFSSKLKLTVEPWSESSSIISAGYDIDYKVEGTTHKYDLSEEVKIGEYEPKVLLATRYAYEKYETDWQIKIDDEGNYKVSSMSDNLFDSMEYDKPNWTHYWMLVGIVYDWYDSCSYNKDTKEYKFTVVDYDSLKLTIVLNFNDTTKLLDKITADLYFKSASEVSLHCNFVAEFSNYGTTTVTGLDIDKLDAAIQKKYTPYTMDAATVTFGPFAWKNSKKMRFIFMPQESPTETYTYNRLWFSKGLDSYGNLFIVNNKVLVENEDYTFENPTGSPLDEIIIKFNETFDSTKPVVIKVDPFLDQDVVTAKLYKE